VLVTLAAMIAVLVALAGCGDGDETADTTTPTANGRVKNGDLEAQRAELRKRLEEARKKKQKKADSGDREKGGDAEPTSPPKSSGPPPTPSGSLPNEGTKRVAPGVPTAKGGDNSIQEYGTEGPASDRVAATGILQAYLDARLAGEWATACSYLSISIRKGLAQFGGQSKSSEPPTCAEIMGALTQGVPKKPLRNAAEIRVISMRIEDEQAFLIYRNGEGTPSSIPMNRQGGQWRVGAIDGSALFLGP
jgi:hypothetical protein